MPKLHNCAQIWSHCKPRVQFERIRAFDIDPPSHVGVDLFNMINYGFQQDSNSDWRLTASVARVAKVLTIFSSIICMGGPSMWTVNQKPSRSSLSKFDKNCDNVYGAQYGQMTKLCFQYLAIFRNENMPNSIQIVSKWAENFAQNQINLKYIAKFF